MADRKLEFFVYNHEERDFTYYEEDRTRLEDIMAAEDPEAVSLELENEEIDGMLVLDEGGGRWYLAFASSMGIVAQRTGRRQADSIVRSGYTLPDGYWLKGNYPMEELNDPNIGDLWRSVQEKYVISDLKGMALDESGIPSQIAERANLLEKEGHSDALTEAKLEKEEAEARKKAAKKTSKKKKKSKKSTAKKTTAKKTTAKKTTAKKTTAKKTTAKKTTAKKATKKKAASKDVMKFLEIEEMATYVYDGKTRIVVKGDLTEGTDDPVNSTVILDQDELSPKEWNEVAIFLSEKDVVQLDTRETSGQWFATSLQV